MVKSKKSKSSVKSKSKIIAKRLSETNLEKDVKEKHEILPDKKKIKNEDEFLNELDDAGIISAGELRQILKSEAKLHQLENLPVTRSLESGLIFVPRAKDKKAAEGKIYADTKYDKQYSGDRYSEKTPGSYAGKESSSGESSKGSDNGSNSNNGNP